MALHARVSMVRNLTTAIRVATRPGSASLSTRAGSLPRMVRAARSGQYQGTSLLKLAALAAAVGYVVSPVDLMPEGLLAVFGLADDAMVLSWIAATLVNETETFLAWEQEQEGGHGPDGHTAYRQPGTPSGHEQSAAAHSTVPGDVIH